MNCTVLNLAEIQRECESNDRFLLFGIYLCCHGFTYFNVTRDKLFLYKYNSFKIQSISLCGRTRFSIGIQDRGC